MSPTLPEITDLVLAALLLELEKDDSIDTCSVAKQPGDSISIDSDCGATVWVRLVDSTPAIASAGDVTGKVCYWGLAHQIELGVVRKSPMPDENLGQLTLPDDDEVSAAADAQYRDLGAMHRALKAIAPHLEMRPGGYSPFGPTGGVVGGTWAIEVMEE